MIQRGLFDRELALAHRDEAVSHVEAGAETETERVVRVIEAVARERPTFTTDDVLKAAPWIEALPERRLLGAAMRRAAERGICQATQEYVTSDRVQSHARPKRLWRSLVQGKGA